MLCSPIAKLDAWIGTLPHGHRLRLVAASGKGGKRGDPGVGCSDPTLPESPSRNVYSFGLR